MSDIQFDDNQRQNIYDQLAESEKPTGFAGWLLEKGIAKDSQSADKILIGCLVLVLILIGLVVYLFL